MGKSFEEFVKEYMSDYEVRADEGDYTPTDQEKLIALDIIMGVVDQEGFNRYFVDKDALVKSIENYLKTIKEIK